MMTCIYIKPRILGFGTSENVQNMGTVGCKEIRVKLSLAILRIK